MLTYGDYLLRPWSPGDAPAFAAVIADDEELRRWTSIRDVTPDRAGEWIQRQLDGWADGSRYSFAVLRGDELLGNVAVKQPGSLYPAELGYWVAAAARGQGVASAAADTATRWAFAELGLTTLDLLHQVANASSCRVAVKAGFALTGLLAPGGAYAHPGHRHTRHATVDS